MGMYDNIKCSYPLPGNPPSFIGVGHVFQTKSLDCGMDDYEITADGKLVQTGSGFGDMIVRELTGADATVPLSYAFDDFTGTIDLYDSNCAGAGPGMYTRDGEDYESVDYRATFVSGKLTSLIEAHRVRKPALPVSRMNAFNPPPATPEQIAEHKRREGELLAGRVMFLRWGGSEETKPVSVVADGAQEWCVRHEGGKLEIVHRWQRDRTLFDSAQEAEPKPRSDGWDERKREYDEYAAKWHAGREVPAPIEEPRT